MNKYDSIQTVLDMFHLVGHGARTPGDGTQTLYLFVVPNRTRLNNIDMRMNMLREHGCTITWCPRYVNQGEKRVIADYTILVSKEVEGVGKTTITLGSKAPVSFFTACYVADKDIVDNLDVEIDPNLMPLTTAEETPSTD